jgi:hypothetical protein
MTRSRYSQLTDESRLLLLAAQHAELYIAYGSGCDVFGVCLRPNDVPEQWKYHILKYDESKKKWGEFSWAEFDRDVAARAIASTPI